MAKTLKEVFGLREMSVNVPDENVKALKDVVKQAVLDGTLPGDAMKWLKGDKAKSKDDAKAATPEKPAEPKGMSQKADGEQDSNWSAFAKKSGLSADGPDDSDFRTAFRAASGAKPEPDHDKDIEAAIGAYDSYGAKNRSQDHGPMVPAGQAAVPAAWRKDGMPGVPSARGDSGFPSKLPAPKSAATKIGKGTVPTKSPVAGDDDGLFTGWKPPSADEPGSLARLFKPKKKPPNHSEPKDDGSVDYKVGKFMRDTEKGSR